MARRHNKPVERLRSSWTSTADLEETLASMFQPAPEPATPAVEPLPPPQFPPLEPVQNPRSETDRDKTTPDITTPDKTTVAITAGVGPPKSSATGGVPTTAPVDTTPVVMTPAIMIPDGGVDEGTEPPPPSITTPDITTRAVTTPVDLSPDVIDDGVAVDISGRPYNIYRCRIAQDGHSRSEQVLYDILWRLGRPAADDSYRFTAVSMKNLAEMPALRMTQKNLRIALQRLVEKLSIEEAQTFDPKAKHARVWKVFGYRAILERRRGAGLEWVVRDRGVRFVDPTTTPVKRTPVVMLDEITTPVITTRTTPVRTAGSTGVKTTRDTILGFPSRTLHSGQTSEPAPAPSTIAAPIIREFGFIDDDALQTLIRKCREAAPDAGDEEIAELGALQAHRIRQMRGVENPIGLLITQVAKCFKGEPLALYRREREQRQQRLEALLEGREDGE